MQGSVNHSKFG